jgi:gluconate kinase
MLDAIEQKEEFSDAMRDEFYRLVAERLPELVSQHGRVIVSQAAFRKRHRKMIQERSVDLEFVWVKAPEELLIERLISRGNEVTPDYLKQVAPNFEVAEGNPRVLVNDSDDENILKYFKEWYR